jgi:hypothetical protein
MPTSHLACRQGSPLVWLKDQSQLAGVGAFGAARSDHPFRAQTPAGVAGQAWKQVLASVCIEAESTWLGFGHYAA